MTRPSARWRIIQRRFPRQVLAELAGLAIMTAGVWMVFEPAAVILAGAGIILWAQGLPNDDNQDDRERRP